MKTIQLPDGRWAALPVALLMTTLAVLPAIAGTQMAFVSDQADNWNNWDIYLRDLASGATTRMTTNTAIDNHPDLSPDGKWVVFSSTRGSGEFDLWLGDVAKVEGTLRQLTFHDHPNGPQTLYPSRHPHFHPNGRMIVFSSKNRPLDSPITIISECSSPKIIVPPRFYEGLNVIQLDASGKATNYIELDIRNAWDSVSFPDIWVPGTGTYVGHPSFSHGGDKIVFAGSIDGDGKVWEVYVAAFDPATGSLITNSLRRVTKGPDFGPNPIKMSAGAHFTEDDSQILFSSTRTAMGNSQIFRLPAAAVDLPVTNASQLTLHPANDYVPEPLPDGSFIVTSDLGTNGLCWPGPGPTADLDLVRINSGGGRQVLGNEADNELLLIADEVSWFCGLKPNLSSCTFQPRIMNGEALWLEFTAYDNPATSPLPPDLLAGFGYRGQAVSLYSDGFWNMSQYMTKNAASTWKSVMSYIERLNTSRFPGLDNDTALTNWLANTEAIRNQKFVVASIMQSLGVGPHQEPPQEPPLVIMHPLVDLGKGRFQFQVATTPGLLYQVESVTGLVAQATWTPRMIFSGDGNTLTVPLPLATTGNEFFRLVSASTFPTVNVPCGGYPRIYVNIWSNRTAMVTIQVTDRCRLSGRSTDSEVTAKDADYRRIRPEPIPDGGTRTVSLEVPPLGSIELICSGENGGCDYTLSAPQ
ncbi:MAG: PD40 domain-containing protein [Chloroflexi bacterium]|nr:PD40 domain-containing protein [Chloroflexota bacterium]